MGVQCAKSVGSGLFLGFLYCFDIDTVRVTVIVMLGDFLVNISNEY